MSSSTNIVNSKKDILILGKGPTQGPTINFTVPEKKFCLSLHYNGANSYLFVYGKEIDKFKAKDSEIVATVICLGNISPDWSVDNMVNTGLIGFAYNFTADKDVIAVNDILDIRNYLLKKNVIE